MLYFVAYLDRVNVGFAALQMNAALGLSPLDYGRGAGIGLINSVGNLGGFVGPYLMGWMQGVSGDFHLGLRVLAASAIGSGLLVLSVGATAGKARESRVRVS